MHGLVNPKILLVDDEPRFARLVSGLLSSALAGADVTTAPSGAAALEALRSAAPDVILLDWHLPDTGGAVLLQEITSAAPGARVIVVTGDTSKTVLVQALRLGASAVVAKPFDPEALVAAVEQAALETARDDTTPGAEVVPADFSANLPAPVDPYVHKILNRLAEIHAGICALALQISAEEAGGIPGKRGSSPEALRNLADAVRSVSALVASAWPTATDRPFLGRRM